MNFIEVQQENNQIKKLSSGRMAESPQDTVHDKHKGIPKISNKVRKWLEKNSWKGND